MGLDFHFYFQKRENDGWIVPPAFVSPCGYDHDLGYFTWFDDKDVAVQLFFGPGSARPHDPDASPLSGPHGLFPMRADMPPGFESTRLYTACRLADEATRAEKYRGWLPFEDLTLDRWGGDLLVRKLVPRQHARLFGDGRQPFPRERLLAEGLAQADVDGIENTSYYARDVTIVDESIDWSDEDPPAWEKTPVTWRVSIGGFLGEWRTKEFKALRRHGPDADLRIICIFS